MDLFYPIFICIFYAGLLSTQLSTGTDPQALLPFWQWQDKHFSIRLVQRLPDQTRGFFMARKFSGIQAEEIAQSCIFQTVIKNISTPLQKITVKYDLNDWHIIHQKRRLSIKTQKKWKKYWNKLPVNSSAKIAFRWSLIPDKQVYQSQDYNWGMSSFGLPPGAIFDLELSWYENDKKRQAKINRIQCAPDIHPDPSKFRDGDVP